MSLTIESNKIHLWCVSDTDITCTIQLSNYYSLLKSEERLQYSRFVHKADKNQYLVTRALIRYVLSTYDHSVQPEQWEFLKNSFGKPYIANHTKLPLKFNISHSKGMVVMAVTLFQDIGVDVENTTRKVDYIDIAKNYFSKIESEIMKLNNHNESNYFYTLWTLKEAYIKARGMGLSIPLNSFSFILSKNDDINIKSKIIDNDKSQNWNFWQVIPSSQHIIAIAVNNSNSNSKLLIFKMISLTNFSECKFPYTFNRLIKYK